MKAINTAMKRRCLQALFILLVSFAAVNEVNAQLPDCLSGTVAYTIFNDSISSAWSSTLDSVEIRSVNLLTGVVGPLMGGKRYWIRKFNSGPVGNNSSYIYGSSALAVDFPTSRFYVMTQMSGSLPKDIITIDPVTATQTIIGTTPASLDAYHFVKMAASNNGWIYAIGVVRDTTLVASNRINPLIRFQTCGLVPSAGCATATIQILGYLPNTPLTMERWLLFNGDISFDNAGNLFFATAAFERVGGANRYTDSRLFKINAADLPVVPGTPTIPMSLIADYNTLDSTVINGVGFDGTGNMFLTTRRYLGSQNPPLPPFKSELYSSATPGSVTLLPAFAPPTAGTSASDLATCLFPAAILAKHDVHLTGQNISGSSTLKWEVFANNEAQYYEVQKSRDGTNYETIAQVNVVNPDQPNQKYSFTDVAGESGSAKYYRVREVLQSGTRYYSNIIRLNGAKISLNGNIKPNPFSSQFELAVQLRVPNSIDIRISDQSGRVVYQRSVKGHAGENNIVINQIANVRPGVYFIEISADNEVIREKLVKQ